MATQDALYGPAGFFRREVPADHFRTSVHASDLFAGAVERLAAACGARTVIDLGAGRGELLTALLAREPSFGLVGVEVAARPAGLSEQIAWMAGLPDRLDEVLVLANEWLDDVPVDVVEVDDVGVPRILHVEPATGVERFGPIPSRRDAEWLAWWPLDGLEAGARAEIGHPRDEAWASVVRSVRRGVLVAVDYCHLREARPLFGTLAGYREGRMVMPVPDGSCDVTAHVALDACAAAGDDAGAAVTVLATQRVALRALGVDASLPPRALARKDPPAYVAALSMSSQAAELLDPAGLGGFGWLVQTVGGVALPEPLRHLPPADAIAAELGVGTGYRLGPVGAESHDPVGGVDVDHAGFERSRLGVVGHPVGDDDHDVALGHQPGGGSVDADDTGAALTGDGVGRQARAIGDIDDVHLFPGEKVSGIE
jgi:SAM-dependent MidA family methyltransferase